MDTMDPISREQFASLIKDLKPRLKRELRFVPEEIAAWDKRDFLAVANKQGSEGVLVVPFLDMAVVPFSLQRRKPNASGRVEAIICDVCATWQRGTASAMITFSAGERRTISFLCCADLGCSLHVRGLTKEATLSRVQLREQLTPESRIVRLKDRLKSILSTLG